jgi:hypothetical protein
VQRAILLDQSIEVRVVERAHYDPQWVTVNRVCERPDLPPAQVRCQKQNALAPPLSSVEVLEPFVNGDFGDVLPPVLWKTAKLG